MSDTQFDKTKVINSFIVAEPTENDNKVIARISTNALNRNNLIINQFGIDWTNYLKNPVVLPFHNTEEKPIGLAQNFQISEAQTVCEIIFNDTKEGQDFKYLYKNGFMKAFSVGLLPVDVKLNDNDTVSVDKSEGLEISGVTIPADPNALVLRNCINNVKTVKLKKEFERQLFEILINSVDELKNKIEQDKRYDELNEKIDKAFQLIAESKNMLDIYEQNKQTDEFKKIQEIQNSIVTIKNDYKKINDLLEAYKQN